MEEIIIMSFRHYFAVGKNKELLINIAHICSDQSNKSEEEEK